LFLILEHFKNDQLMKILMLLNMEQLKYRSFRRK